jgi:hypothetical protein
MNPYNQLPENQGTQGYETVHLRKNLMRSRKYVDDLRG